MSYENVLQCFSFAEFGSCHCFMADKIKQKMLKCFLQQSKIAKQNCMVLLMAEILHLLRLVVSPIIYKVLAPSQVVGNGISAINSMKPANETVRRSTQQHEQDWDIETSHPASDMHIFQRLNGSETIPLTGTQGPINQKRVQFFCYKKKSSRPDAGECINDVAFDLYGTKLVPQ